MAWIRKFRTSVEAPDYDKYIGHHVRVTEKNGDERVVEIKRCVFNLAEPTDIEIESREDGKQYVICALDFMAQMNGDRVSKAEIADFKSYFHQMKIKVSAPRGYKPKGKD